MRLVRGGLQSCPHGRETWLYDFYIDESPVSAVEFSTFLGDRSDEAEVLGEFAAGMTFENAEGYANWSGKRLPNAFEWYAAKWQLAAGHAPEVWLDWSMARRRMFERIERSVRGEIWDGQPLLPGQQRPYPDGTSAKPSSLEIEQLRSGEWLRKDPEIEAAFLQRMAEFNVGNSEPSEMLLRLVSLLALSTQPLEKRILSLRQTASLSPEELIASCARLESEQGQGDNLRQSSQAQEEFIDWLFHGPHLSRSENVRRLMAGGWLQDNTRLKELFEEKMVVPLASNQVGFAEILAHEMAVYLAGSISLTLDEKKRILAASSQLSLFQLKELLNILQEEQQKFFELDPEHLPELEERCLRHNSLIVAWLLEENPGAYFQCSTGDLRAVWSSTLGGLGSGRTVLLENPLKDRAWTRHVLKSAEKFERGQIGIRCVLPIATATDLNMVTAL